MKEVEFHMNDCDESHVEVHRGFCCFSIQDKQLLIGKQQMSLLPLKRETNTKPSTIGPSP
jgi:hypothetical protein